MNAPALVVLRRIGAADNTRRGNVILAKLDSHTQLEAVAKAMRWGLIDVEVSD